MLRFLPWWLLCGLMLAGSALTYTQDVEQTYGQLKQRAQEQPLRLSGGLGLGAQLASINNASAARYDDFDWSFQARLNVDLLGVQLPFSAYVSDRNRLYNLPSYQFVGLSPTYKWATLHAGDRSLNFNPYTFSNQQFRGIGTELTPGKWRFAGMYGRLNRLQLGDFNARQDLAISYRRMGWAGEAGYQNDKFGLKAILFGAEDQMPDDLGENPIRGLAPARNLVASLEGNLRIGKNLRWHTTLARSFLTDNTQAANLPDSILNRPLVPGSNASTSRDNAILSTLNYQRPKANWQLSYERLSPNYRSLGTFYLTPDRENLTAGGAFNFSENKYTVSLNGGLQRNNLAGDRASTQRRLIAQVAATARPADRLSATLNLSNFNNTSRLRSFFDPTSSTDSLFLAQVNRSGRLGLRWNNAKNKPPGAWSLDFSTQDARALRDEVLTTFRSRIYNTYLAYSGQLAAWGLSYRLQTLYGSTRAEGLGNRLISPSIALVRSFDEDRVNLSFTGSYSNVDYENRGDGAVWLARLGAKFAMTKTSYLHLRAQHTLRRISDRPTLSETIIALNYAWNF